MVFLWFFGLLAFGDTGQEEIDFLLFLPNSSNSFVNQEQTMVQLDNIAKHILDRNLISGQIHVFGYAAAVANEIDPVILSMERALFVMNELQERGVPGDLFSDPIAHGAVYLWGGNTNEAERSPNRRVRILLEGIVLTPAMLTPVVSGLTTPGIVVETPVRNVISEPRSGFPWLLLLPLLLLPFILFALIRKKRGDKTALVKAAYIEPVAAITPIIEPVILPVAKSESLVYLEEEIRRRAYELYLERGGQNGDAEGDWLKALPEVCSRYEAEGYRTYIEDGAWWAHRSS